MRQISILIINPNSTASMTAGLEPLIDSLGYDNTTYTFFTSPAPSPSSINSPADAAKSTTITLPHVLPLLPAHDAFLIACYSPHPLVSALRHHTHKPVLGIFEASISVAMTSCSPTERFGIVSTGKIWEAVLSEAVSEFFGTNCAENRDEEEEEREKGNGIKAAAPPSRFAGVETTGLNATELHAVPAPELARRMSEATARLLRRGRHESGTETGRGHGHGDANGNETTATGKVRAICLGCAGMSGLDAIVRGACVAELGPGEGERVKIVDGVLAGVGLLQGMVRMGL
ncbi:MAG: hypothetical protein M1819_005662 [Sarea resinae]|nr:MAG: hypothetical protein M1819_005662 [Sarea resinae]